MGKQASVRTAAFDVLAKITKDGEYSGKALKNALGRYQYLEKRDRAFITRLVLGTLEHMTELDYIIDCFSDVETGKMKPAIKTILRMGVYQLKYMDNVPQPAVCAEAVKLAGQKGFGTLKGFVNGVLRNIARNLGDIKYPEDMAENLSVRYSMPQWITDLLSNSYDADTVRMMLQDFLKEKPLTVRCNISKTSPDALKKRLEEEGVTADAHPYLPYVFRISGYDHITALRSFKDGLFAVQDISCALAGEAAGVKPGDYIIDVCASPGGKALHAADLLKGTGFVDARDISDYKVGLIKENIGRMGFKNIEARRFDALVKDEASTGKADIVIADLPCSGLGALGKKPDLKYRLKEADIKELAALQRKMLDMACLYVKEGGALIYSTCTITHEENEANAEDFLKRHKDFAPEDITPFVCEELKGRVTNMGCIKLLPGINDSDGFFIAKFRRRPHIS